MNHDENLPPTRMDVLYLVRHCRRFRGYLPVRNFVTHYHNRLICQTMEKIISLTLFALGIAAYAISQLQQHGKLKWSKGEQGFWGNKSDKLKYKNTLPLQPTGIAVAPDNWYYRLIGSDYKERWFTSTWLTVAFTDGYHAMQAVSFLCFGGSASLALHIGFLWIWLGILAIHTATRKLLGR